MHAICVQVFDNGNQIVLHEIFGFLRTKVSTYVYMCISSHHTLVHHNLHRCNHVIDALAYPINVLVYILLA